MIPLKTKYKLLLFGIACLLSQIGLSQTFTITTNNATFNANTATIIESGVTNTTSFTLNINSRTRTYNLHAGITSKTYNPTSTVFPSMPLSIALRSISGVATTGGVSGSLQLVENPPSLNTLATNATATSTSKTAVWTYDLTLLPLGYTIAPGTYTFNLNIRYTDGATTINRAFPITLTVQPFVNLGLTVNASNTVNFSTSANYLSGVTNSNYVTHGVKSNRLWLVNVASQSAFFTAASAGADNNMPCSIVSIKKSTNATFLNLSTAVQTLNTGSAGNTTATGNTYNIDMRFNPGYNYNAGIYNLSLVYTLTNQ